MKSTKPAQILTCATTLTLLLPAIAVFLLHGFLVKAFVADKIRRRRILLRNISGYSRFALRLMRIQVDARIEGRWVPATESQLLVCNHMSYLDMLVLASIKPSVFVTSVDMGQQFFLGTMAEIAGAVFIERRHRERVAYDVSQLENVLLQGFDVTLFPEGTSGDGSDILPFKRSMFLAAINTRRPVRPLTLRYARIDGTPFGPENRDIVCWYGKMDFVSHLVKLCAARSVDVEVTIHHCLEIEREADKAALAEATRHIIVNEYFRRPAFPEWPFQTYPAEQPQFGL